MSKDNGFKIAPVLACIVTMLSVGIVYMWSVFQQPVMDYYGWEKTAVSFISAINIMMFVFGVFIGGLLVDRVMAGTGVGLAYAGATNCLQKWFPTRRGFACKRSNTCL